MFFWILELAIHNANIIHNENRVKAGLKIISLLQFQTELVDLLSVGNEAVGGEAEPGQSRAEPEREDDDETRTQAQAPYRVPRNDPWRRLVGGFKEVTITVTLL